jgi:hypothetical protein
MYLSPYNRMHHMKPPIPLGPSFWVGFLGVILGVVPKNLLIPAGIRPCNPPAYWVGLYGAGNVC